MNKWIGIGRLVDSPDIKYTDNGDSQLCIARYTLAVDRKFKREGEPTADFIRCVAFNKAGQFAEKYFHKGIKIAVEGHIQTGSYKGKDGKTVYTTDVIVENQEFAENKEHGGHAQAPAKPQPKDDFVEVPNDDSGLPFNF